MAEKEDTKSKRSTAEMMAWLEQKGDISENGK